MICIIYPNWGEKIEYEYTYKFIKKQTENIYLNQFII